MAGSSKGKRPWWWETIHFCPVCGKLSPELTKKRSWDSNSCDGKCVSKGGQYSSGADKPAAVAAKTDVVVTTATGETQPNRREKRKALRAQRFGQADTVDPEGSDAAG